MVTVTIRRNAAGEIVAFRGDGHAGHAPRGSDVVCAAVSVLLQTVVLGLTERIGLPVGLSIEGGVLDCRLPPSPDESRMRQAQVLLDTMVLGLRGIVESYPKHVSVHEETEP